MYTVMDLKTYIKDLLHVFLPDQCMACNTVIFAHEFILCAECLYHLPLTDFHLDAQNETAKQLWGKLDFEVALSMLYLSKRSRTEHLLHQLKYGNRPQIGIFLGKLYGKTIKELASQQQFDMIIAIPIHRKKRRERGYNQAYQFAKGLSDSLCLPVSQDILQRKIYSISQTKKNRSERYENVAGVFTINPNKAVLKDKHILLVDDILTTGATICEAGLILCQAGAKVSILTIARA